MQRGKRGWTVLLLGSLLPGLVAGTAVSPTYAQTPSDWQYIANATTAFGKAASAGRWAEAEQLAEQQRAYLQRRGLTRIEHIATASVAQARYGLGRYQEALPLYQEALEQAKNFRPQTPQERNVNMVTLGESLRGCGISIKSLGDPLGGAPYIETAVKWYRDNNLPAVAAETQKDLANLYRGIHDFAKADGHFRQVVAVMEPRAARERPPGVETVVLGHALSGWAITKASLGRNDLAEPMLQRAYRLLSAVHGRKHESIAEVWNNLGIIQGSQSRIDDAAVSYRNAIAVWEATLGPHHQATMTAVLNLAGVLQQQDKDAEAEELCRRAVAVRQEHVGPEHPQTAHAQWSLANVLSSRSKHDEASQHYRQAIATFKSALGPTDLQAAMATMDFAVDRFLAGNTPAGLELLAEVERSHQQNPLPPTAVIGFYSYRAAMQWTSGKRAEAVSDLDKALELEEINKSYSYGSERERAGIQRIRLSYEAAVQWQAELNDAAKMFQQMERRKGKAFLDELRLRNADLLAGVSAAERQRLAQRETELRVALSAAERRLDELPMNEPGGTPAAQAERERRSQAMLAAREALYRHERDVRSTSPVYRQLLTQQTESVTLRQLQAHVGDNELVLSYFMGEQRSYVMAVQQGAVTFAELVVDEPSSKVLEIEPGRLTIGKLNQALLDEESGVLSALSRPPQSGRDPHPRLAALWQLLIPEAERTGITSGKVLRLTILPDGGLSLLPFETLVVSGAGGEDPQYLLDVGPPITYAPSAAVLMNLADRQARSGSGREPLFTLGDPAYQPAPQSPETTRKVRAAERFRAGLSRLPFTGWESTWVQQMFDKAGMSAVRVTGPQATEAAIRQNVSGREIVHLACHGMADQTYGNFFGALAVAPGKAGDPRDDGFLSMSEIYELELAACELAILSACETNFGPQQEGEGVWALSRGFLVAGARRVIASNWIVDDQAGATLVSYFATYLTRGGKNASTRDYAKALHEAKQQIRKTEKWSHPFYWSNLVLVGPK